MSLGEKFLITRIKLEARLWHIFERNVKEYVKASQVVCGGTLQ